MKLKLITALLISTSFFTSNGYAFFCPNTFNQINFGDSIAQVEQLCGKPDSKVETDAPDNSPQVWNYYLQQSTSVATDPRSTQAAGSLKTSFAFDAQGKLLSISINGIGVASTNNCGSYVALGDSRKSVESACGKPSFVDKQTPSAGGQSDNKDKQIEMIYKGNPPVTLIFRDGKLAEKN